MMTASLANSEGWKFITPSDIQRLVANHYNVSRADILSSRRTATVVRPRQIAMWLNEEGEYELIAGERRLRIAHNEQFDARIVRIAIKREFTDESMAEAWKDSPAACTARLSTPICALPPTDKMKASRMAFKHKTPNLGEAYKHFTGRDIENAHSALPDVHGCMAVWFGIQDMERAAVAA